MSLQAAAGDLDLRRGVRLDGVRGIGRVLPVTGRFTHVVLRFSYGVF